MAIHLGNLSIESRPPLLWCFGRVGQAGRHSVDVPSCVGGRIEAAIQRVKLVSDRAQRDEYGEGD